MGLAEIVSSDTTLSGVLLAGLAVCGSVIALLYRQICQKWEADAQRHKDTEKRLHDCETDRANLWHEVAEARGITVDEAKQHAEKLRREQTDHEET